MFFEMSDNVELDRGLTNLCADVWENFKKKNLKKNQKRKLKLGWVQQTY